MEKVWGPPAESEKKTRYGADLLHIRSVPVAWVVRGGMHERSPKFGRQWASPSSGPTQYLIKFGHKTHVGSRSVIGFGAFHGENHKKFIRCRKIMKTCTHDDPGGAGMWKLGPPAESEKKTQYGADLLHIRLVPVAWVVRVGMHETSPNFGRQWACPS